MKIGSDRDGHTDVDTATHVAHIIKNHVQTAELFQTFGAAGYYPTMRMT